MRRKILQTNLRNWGLVAGLLLIVAACVAAYLMTIPPEADVAVLDSISLRC